MNPDDITAELRDIKPLIEIPEPLALSPYAVAAIVLLGLLLVAAAAWFLYRRRSPKSVSDPVADAVRELETARALLAEASSEAYAIAVSNVLRRYLERHLGTPAVRQTTDEFLESLAGDNSGPLRTHRESLREFLRLCDLVKFAKGELGQGQRHQLHGAARGFIETTATPPETCEVAPPSTAQTPALA